MNKTLSFSSRSTKFERDRQTSKVRWEAWFKIAASSQNKKGTVQGTLADFK